MKKDSHHRKHARINCCNTRGTEKGLRTSRGKCTHQKKKKKKEVLFKTSK